MKKRYIKITALVALFASLGANAQEGFGTSTPAPSSVVDMVASDKGALLPRVVLTSTIVAAPVTAPVNGLTVFNNATAGTVPNNVTPGYYYWSAGLSKWIRISDATNATASGWDLTGNTGTTAGTAGVGATVDGNFLGTTDAKNLVLGTNNTKRMIIDIYGNAVGGTNSALNLVDAGFGVPWGNFVWGMENVVDNTASSNGYSNTIFGFLNRSTAANSTIFGYNNKDLNTFLDEGYNIIAGNDNTINNSGTGTSTNAIIGSGNTLNAGRSNFVIGTQNTVNNVTTNNSVAIGNNNIVGHHHSFALGSNVTTTADNQFAANFSGGYRLAGISNGTATDELITLGTDGLLHKLAASSLAANNLYTNNGTLAANRTVTMAGNTLSFSDAGGSTQFENSSNANVIVNAAVATGRASLQAIAGSSALYVFVDGGNKAQITTTGSTIGLDIATLNSTPLRFLTNNTEKMVIASNGNVGVATALPTSTMQVTGSIATSLRTTTGSTTLLSTDHTIIKTGAAAATITLPDASTCPGRVYRIVEYAGDGNASTLTIAPAVQTYTSSSGLHTETNFYLLHTNMTAAGTNGDVHSIMIQSDGTNWYSIGR